MRTPDHILARDAQVPAPEYRLARAPVRLPPWPAGQVWSIPHRVGWHDLDFNYHLNNRYYLRWMLDAVPVEVLEKQTLRRLLIHYKREATLGDQLLARSAALSETSYSHQLLGKEEQLLARAYSEWQELT
ncbi:MAG: hypothetical protein D6772_06465 [Bacteroidetes bacterium]|nr:MAG: hypothetical protein D6772_06465 [Bacteroidota bacterium]